MLFWVNCFPLPPSANKQLASVRGRHIKTAVARRFDEKIMHLKSMRQAEWTTIEKSFRPFLKDHVIRVDQYFVFHKDRIFTKTKQAKDWVHQLDHLNFNKASEDGLVKCIGIDDKFFFSGHKEKVWCEDPKQEQIIFRLSLTKPRSILDVYHAQELDRIS